MKHTFLSALVSLISLIATSQITASRKLVDYEAATWKTWLLDNPGQIVMKSSPGEAQSKTELRLIKQRISKIDEKKLADIKYWDAGAPAYRWNQIAPKLISPQRFDVVLRTPTAWMNIAIYDATILAWKEKIKYKRKRPQDSDPLLPPVINTPPSYSYPCEHSVTAAAAATVLAYFFPEKADSIMQLAYVASQSRIDAGVQFPSDTEAGWQLGQQVARQIIEKARHDGSANAYNGGTNKDPKKWTGGFAMGINVSSFSPIVMDSASQFRPPAPPDFETEMRELKNSKAGFKTNSLAYYWANNGGFDYWSDVAGLKMFEYRMSDDPPAVARIYTVLHTAFHEAIIAIFDAKYTYWGIRPVQFDSTYKPLLSTPPFPGYPSGHATGASTSATVLEYFFPADAKYFRQLAQDCADSRFYAGIHFRIDNETGLRIGKEIGKYVVQTWMKK